MTTRRTTIVTALAASIAGIAAGMITTGVGAHAADGSETTAVTVALSPCHRRFETGCYWDGLRLRYEESFSVTTIGGEVCREYVDPFANWALGGRRCVPVGHYTPPALRHGWRTLGSAPVSAR